MSPRTRRQRKCSYWVQVEDMSLWWCGVKYGWHTDRPEGCSWISSDRIVRTFDAAMRAALGAYAAAKSRIVITQLVMRRGARYARTYYYNGD